MSQVRVIKFKRLMCGLICVYNFIFTARKRSLRRLCFYTCLSVILFTGRGGVSRPRPGGVQAQAGGVGVSRPRPRKGCLGPGPRGCPGPGGVCIPACTEADTPQQTATAAGGTHPTECILVYSCGVLIYAFTNTRNLSNLQQGL